MRIFLYLFWLLFAIFILAASYFLFTQSYENFTFSLFESFHQPEKLIKFREIYPIKNFIYSRIFLTLFDVFFLLFSFFFFKKIRKTELKIIAFWSDLKIEFFHFLSPIFYTSKNERYILFGFLTLLTLARSVCILRFPFHIDERFSYLYFVNKGLGASLAYYPNPNNHILYSLLCNISAIFLNNPVWIMKLPVFLLGIIGPFIFFLIIRHFFSFHFSLISTSIFCFSGSVFYYSVQGRGYFLLFLLLIISSGSLLKIVHSPHKNNIAESLFMISSALGFYTIPIFLYPFTGLMIFAFISSLQKPPQKLLRLFMVLSMTFLLTFILYLPVLLFNGWGSLSGNSWVVQQNWDEYKYKIYENLQIITGGIWFDFPISVWLFLIQIILCTIWFFNKRTTSKEKNFLGLILSVWLVIIPLVILHKVTVYQRVYSYLWVFQSVFLTLLLEKTIRLFVKNNGVYKNLVLYIATFCIIFYTIFPIYQIAFHRPFDFYNSADAIIKKLSAEKAGKIYFNSYEYSLCVRSENEMKYIYTDLYVQDFSPEKRYYFMVLEKNYPIPDTTGYKKIYDDPLATIYKLK